MSWKVINEVIGLASIDAEFCKKLLEHPVEAIEAAGYQLTKHEREVLQNIQANDIYEFSKKLLAEFS